MSASGNDRDVAVLGVGMHPWGKWGRNFVSYGVHAAREALKDSGVAWAAHVGGFVFGVLGGLIWKARGGGRGPSPARIRYANEPPY